MVNSTNDAIADISNVDHVIVLTKEAQRVLQPLKIEKQMEALIKTCISQTRSRTGWHCEPDMSFGDNRGEFWKSQSYANGYRYTVRLILTYKPQSDTREAIAIRTEFENIVRNFHDRASLVHNGGWTFETIDERTLADFIGKKFIEAANVGGKDANIGYAAMAIPQDWNSHFGHLYGLDAQIERVKRALEASERSGWRNRFHCALIGPPGCGKSDLCQSIKNALGASAVMEFDATSTTMAGAQKNLGDRLELPRVLLVEEIEKAESALTWLLSVLDLRGEIRKTTAKGNIQKDTKMLAVATVNDYRLFKKLNSGALASRFANRIFFQRPGRELLERILLREIDKVDGNRKWATPALNYCEENKIYDPREVIAICMVGAEKLLTGEYQRMLDATREPPEEDVEPLEHIALPELRRRTRRPARRRRVA